jgi:hypothetical protein
MESIAPIVYFDEAQVIVACPFCRKTHRHGDGGSREGVEGSSRSAHCPAGGEYTIRGFYDFSTAGMALSRREADVLRKRAARAKVRETKET